MGGLDPFLIHSTDSLGACSTYNLPCEMYPSCSRIKANQRGTKAAREETNKDFAEYDIFVTSTCKAIVVEMNLCND